MLKGSEEEGNKDGDRNEDNEGEEDDMQKTKGGAAGGRGLRNQEF